MPQSRQAHPLPWPLLLLGAALWLLTHPYGGIAGDARFYNVQFLRALAPAAFQPDLYFRYGSQDDFSAFTPAFAPVIGLLGLNAGNIVLAIGLQCLWLGGLWSCLTALVASRVGRALAFAAVVALPGGINFVHYGDPLLTPRLLAEGLSLWALSAMLRDRAALALLVLAASFSFHPLMTLPTLGILFLDQAAKHRLWWSAALAGMAAVAGLVWLEVPPFSHLADRYDAQWFAVVNVRDGFCLIANWQLADWLPVCNTLVFATVSLAATPPGRGRRLLARALIVAVGGLAASFAGADVMHLSMVTEAQFWRAFWLLSLLANACFALTLLRLWRGTAVTPVTGALVLAASLLALSRFLVAFIIFPAPLAALAGGAWWIVRRWPQARRSVQAALLLATAVTVALASIAIVPSLHHLAIGPAGVWPPLLRLILTGVCLASAILGIAAPLPPRWRRLRATVPALAIIVAAFAMALWDARSPWSRFVETAPPPPALTALLPAHAQVYWEGGAELPWFLLRRADYFSCEQGTGALFNRGTAITYQSRYDSFRALDPLDFQRDRFCPGEPRTAKQLVRTDLETLCRREPSLDDVVLTAPVSGEAREVWEPPVPFQTSTRRQGESQAVTVTAFFIYRCADYRAVPTIASPTIPTPDPPQPG